jgi:hypothetical protein
MHFDNVKFDNISIVPPIPPVAATGGTVTTVGNYKIHTFTSSDTFTVTAGGNVQVVAVAAGGGGGGGRNDFCHGAYGGNGGSGVVVIKYQYQ